MSYVKPERYGGRVKPSKDVIAVTSEGFAFDDGSTLQFDDQQIVQP